jgi:hypothetical protein
MESIATLIEGKMEQMQFRIKARKISRTWELASKAADLTGDKPHRWLREAKNNPHFLERGLSVLREVDAREPSYYLAWLMKHYRTESLK